MKTILLTTIVATCLGMPARADTDASAATNAPATPVLEYKDASTNAPVASAPENKNAPPALMARATDPATTESSTSSTTAASTVTAPPPVNAHAYYNDRRFEAGAIFGEPTGVSLKYWFNDTVAVDGALGWSFHHNDDFYIHSDVLWHAFNVIPVSKGALPLYFGVGGRVQFRDNQDDRVGIRIPVGLNYLFEGAPVSLFLEVAPVLDLSPSTRGDITAGIGVRYRF